MHTNFPSDAGQFSEELRNRLLDEARIILLDQEITDSTATLLIANLLYLEHCDPEQPIRLFINSTGGQVSGGLAIIDTIDRITPPVHTHCFGGGDGMAGIILAHGEKGNRSASPHARFAIQLPKHGRLIEVGVYLEELLRVRSQLAEILAADTGKSRDDIIADMEKEIRLDAEGGVGYHLIDHIIDLLPLECLHNR